jgi:hypothetical protein
VKAMMADERGERHLALLLGLRLLVLNGEDGDDGDEETGGGQRSQGIMLAARTVLPVIERFCYLRVGFAGITRRPAGKLASLCRHGSDPTARALPRLRAA